MPASGGVGQQVDNIKLVRVYDGCCICNVNSKHGVSMKRDLNLLAVENALLLICEEMLMPIEQVRQFVTEAVETAKDGFMYHPHNSYNPANLAHLWSCYTRQPIPSSTVLG